MSETKIKIPEGMLEAAAMELSDVGFRSNVIAYDVKRMLKAALRWLSENPILPTPAQVHELTQLFVNEHGDHYTFDSDVLRIIVEWERRMFLAPELEAPEWISDLQCSDVIYAIEKAGFRTMKFGEDGLPRFMSLDETRDAGRAAIEAYRRGKEGK